jgi:hypothetical protein
MKSICKSILWSVKIRENLLAQPENSPDKFGF